MSETLTEDLSYFSAEDISNVGKAKRFLTQDNLLDKKLHDCLLAVVVVKRAELLEEQRHAEAELANNQNF